MASLELTAADGHRFAAYRADPEGAPRASVVVVQEIFGVNGHIREVADRYAAEGYLAIAPALFDRIEPGIELEYDAAGLERGKDRAARLDPEATLARSHSTSAPRRPQLPFRTWSTGWKSRLAAVRTKRPPLRVSMRNTPSMRPLSRSDMQVPRSSPMLSCRPRTP